MPAWERGRRGYSEGGYPFSSLQRWLLKLGRVAHAYYPNSDKAEARRLLWVQGQLWLLSEFQVSLNYIVKTLPQQKHKPLPLKPKLNETSKWKLQKLNRNVWLVFLFTGHCSDTGLHGLHCLSGFLYSVVTQTWACCQEFCQLKVSCALSFELQWSSKQWRVGFSLLNSIVK